ncbi:MAG: nucleoside monophosphate kinase [Acidobacteriota bacterium]|nr:nucleoside monophosphate kinase [Acidobacteriota bacterium]
MRTSQTRQPQGFEIETFFVSTEDMSRMGVAYGACASRVVLFLGAPGSGKGTQSAWLSQQLGMPSLSTGDMLRAEAKRNTKAGVKLRTVLASGALADDKLVCAAVRARLHNDLPKRGIILDGFPRTVAQAKCLDEILCGMGMPGPLVLHLDVSRDNLLSRLTARRHCESCGTIYNLLSRPSARGAYCETDGAELQQREDDSEAVIRRRLTAFDLSSAPLIEYYSHTDYHRIDGNREPEPISRELMEIAGQERTRAAA